MKKIAVILCGSGYLDGSEIRESVGALWALSSQPVEVQCFAPDKPQTEVVNCLTAKTAEGESRNQLIEAARIARGKVLPLSNLRSTDYAGIVLPGGFGAAKNLCDFAYKGSLATVIPELKNALLSFHNEKKPIGAICIAPAIVALALKGKNLELTVGEVSEASQEVEKLGHRHIVCAVDKAHTDSANRIVTTPAYMYANASLDKIFTGIESLVKQVVSFI
jgi:enhancing lycopene biosynthesis protein 2